MDLKKRPLFRRKNCSGFNVIRGRTNNATDGFKSKFNCLMNKNNTNFIEILFINQEIQQVNDFELHILLFGGEPKRKQILYQTRQ